MRLIRASLLILACLAGARPAFAAPIWSGPGVFEVKGQATQTLFVRDGEAVRLEGGDEVVYRVDLPKRTVTRTAIYSRTSRAQGEVHDDATEYQIISGPAPDLATGEWLIKAFGRTGNDDGYEILVISQDAVTTATSYGTVFELTRYQRTDESGRTP